MKLNIEQIKDITIGAERVIFENGRYKFLRFTENETKIIDNPNILYTAGIQMEFKTDGKLLKLKVYTSEANSIRSYFAFDVFVDGVLNGSVQNISDKDCEGNYAEEKYSLGSFENEFELGVGEKCVKIVFPHSVIGEIEEIDIEGASYIKPVKKEKVLVMYGDSITQGYDALHPSGTYAVKLAETLGAKLINKALGGATFLPELAESAAICDADYVVVAYGTNDWNVSDIENFRGNAEAFLSAIEKKYKDIPTYIITPIWRKDLNRITKFGEFSLVECIIKEICEKYKNIRVVSGIELVPHDESLFGDLRLHPSEKGFDYYFRNLVKVIE